MNNVIKLEVGSVAHLENGGNGLVFAVRLNDQNVEMPDIPAFAVRYQDKVRVFKNICGHIAINLDFVAGQFFDEEGEHLMCATHGALYAPTTGRCLGGPCFGVGLEVIEAKELEGILYITDLSVNKIILDEK